jgi:hypothetical protein
MRTSAKRLIQVSLVWLFVLAWTGGCGGEFHEPWREQKLPGGKSVKVKSLQIAWGVEHDEPRHAERDCFVLQFVYTVPDGGDEVHYREAKQVFELIRSISEQWGFTSAELMAYSTSEPSRHYDLFVFQQSAAGDWSSKLEHRF